MIKELEKLREATENINEWLDLKHIINYIAEIKAGGFYHDLKTVRWLEFLVEKAQYNRRKEAPLLESALKYIRDSEKAFYMR